MLNETFSVILKYCDYVGTFLGTDLKLASFPGGSRPDASFLPASVESASSITLKKTTRFVYGLPKTRNLSKTMNFS